MVFVIALHYIPSLAEDFPVIGDFVLDSGRGEAYGPELVCKTLMGRTRRAARSQSAACVFYLIGVLAFLGVLKGKN